MMLGRSRIAIAVVLVATELTMPAHSQLPDGLRLLPERPSQEQIDYLRDLTIKAARMAVQDDAAKVEITTLVVGVDYPPGVIVEHYTHPYACGYVTSSFDPRQRFIYYYSKAQLFASLKDEALIDAMNLCGFLPKSPPPPDENSWGNLKY